MAELSYENTLTTSPIARETSELLPDTVVEMFHLLVEEQSVKIKLKLKDLDSEWKIATAVKKRGGFSIVFENSDTETLFFADDDESSSLVSEDLWKCGWFALLEGDCSLKSSAPSQISMQEEKCSIEFSGSHYETLVDPDGFPYTLFQSFTRTQRGNQFFVTAKYNVLSNNENVLFFFAARPTDKAQHQLAFVYNLKINIPEVVFLDTIAAAEKSLTISGDKLTDIGQQMMKFVQQKQTPKNVGEFKECISNERNQELGSDPKRKSARANKRPDPYSPEELACDKRSKEKGSKKKKNRRSTAESARESKKTKPKALKTELQESGKKKQKKHANMEDSDSLQFAI